MGAVELIIVVIILLLIAGAGFGGASTLWGNPPRRTSLGRASGRSRPDGR
jgi:hypothetical protein